MECICRICLKSTNDPNNIFEDDIPNKIEAISSVLVYPNDKLPHNLCLFCKDNIKLMYEFRDQIIRSNNILLKRLEEICKAKSMIKLEESAINSEDCSDTNYCDDNDEGEPVLSDVDKLKIGDFIDNQTKIRTKCASKNNLSSTKTFNSLKTYLCHFCKYQTHLFDEYKSHRKQHVVPSPTTLCNVCGQWIRSCYLTKHLLTHSSVGAPCKICGKVLKNRESLRGHMEMHKNIKFECKMCDKVYNCRTAITRHLKRHALGDARIYECSVCKKRFFDNDTLKKHMQTHTGERPHPCQYCKKGFSSRHALKTHTRQHTNEKPYACKYCDSAFHQNVSLRTHLKSKHSDKPDYLNIKIVENS